MSWFSSQPCQCLIWVTLASGVGVHLTYLLNEQIGPIHFFLDFQTQDVPTIQSQSCAQGLAEAVGKSGRTAAHTSKEQSRSEEKVNAQHEDRMVQQGMQMHKRYQDNRTE